MGSRIPPAAAQSKSGSRCCLIAKAEPPLDRLGRPRPVAHDRGITPGGVRRSGLRSRLGSDLDKLFRWLRHVVGLTGEAQDEVGALTGLCAGDKDKTGIVSHRLEPASDVSDVVFEVF